MSFRHTTREKAWNKLGEWCCFGLNNSTGELELAFRKHRASLYVVRSFLLNTYIMGFSGFWTLLKNIIDAIGWKKITFRTNMVYDIQSLWCIYIYIELMNYILCGAINIYKYDIYIYILQMYIQRQVYILYMKHGVKTWRYLIISSVMATCWVLHHGEVGWTIRCLGHCHGGDVKKCRCRPLLDPIIMIKTIGMMSDGWVGNSYSPKTNMTMEQQPFEDVSPIKNGVFPLSY